MMTPRHMLAAGFALVALATSATAQSPYTWNTTSSGNWNTAANWLDAGNNQAVPTSGAATALIFGASGTTSYTATNDIGAFTLNSLTINNTGSGVITIAGSSTSNTLTFAGTDPTINVSSGTVLFTGLMAGSATVIKSGSGTFIHDSNNSGFTGTVVINGGTFVNRATTTATTNFNPVSIVVNNGGTYQFGENTTGDPNLPNSTYITVNSGGTVNWQEGETFGGFHLQGGTINFQQGGVTSSGSTAQSWTSGTLTGGAFTVAGAAAINKTGTGTVTISGQASITTTTGGFNIQEGIVVHETAANLGTSNIALGAATTSGTFEYRGVSASRGGTFALNAGGGTINVTNAATALTLSGAFSGSGSLTKSGNGTLFLSGALGHSGLTTVAAGTLRVTPVSASGSFALANSTTLAVNSGAGTASFTTPGLNLGSGGTTLRFDLTGSSLPNTSLLVVSGSDGLNLNGGTHTLSISNPTGLSTGTFTAIDYTGTGITSGFTLKLPGRTTGNLTYDTTNTRIDVTVTGSDTIKWTGAINGNWDVGSAPDVGGTNNWKLVTAGTATNFIDTDIVTFDDTASRFTVDVTTSVSPNSATFNHGTGNTYLLQGSGKITGSATLTKQGAGTTILATDNDYSGGTTISAGTLQIGNGGTSGSITGNVAMSGGTLAFNRSNNASMAVGMTLSGNAAVTNIGSGAITLTSTVSVGSNELTIGGSGNLLYGGVISGNGTIVKNGAGTTTMLASNSFTGTLTINAGIVRVQDAGAGGDLNAASIVINNGGKFEFVGPDGNPDLPANTVITINSGGIAEFTEPEDYGGIILKGGAYRTSDNHNFSSGVTSVLESGTIDELSGGAGGAFAGAGAIQKTTTGTVTITGVDLNNTGGLAIDNGILSTDSAIGGSGTISFGAEGNATLRYRGGSASVTRAISLAEGGGTFEVTQAGTAYTLSGVVSGVGALTKSGTGTLILTGNNDYQGGTTVSAGTLLANGQTGSNSGTGSGAVVVNGGTLGGTGRIAGTVTVNSGGAIRGGAAGSTGTLTVASNIVIANGGILAADLGASGSNSVVAMEGAGTTIDFKSGSVVSLSSVSGFDAGTGGTYALVTLPSGSGVNVLLNGSATTDGQVLGTYVQGTGASGAVTINTSGFSLNTGDTLTLTRTGDAVVMTFAPVPEPATVLGLAAGVLGLGGLVRRRFRKTAPVA